MFFRRNKDKCKECKSVLSEDYSYCPYCGTSLITKEQNVKDYGLLGRHDAMEEEMMSSMDDRMGFADKIFNSLISSLMKNLEKQMRDMEKVDMEDPQSGVKIKISGPMTLKQPRRHKHGVGQIVSDDQVKRMSDLPRAAAKTSVRRLSDKVVYELATPGVLSPHDIFVSKLENGYEIKAIGAKKVYVNSLPINLPIKSLSLSDDKLLVEFKIQK